jgi:hypothetical protein
MDEINSALDKRGDELFKDLIFFSMVMLLYLS